MTTESPNNFYEQIKPRLYKRVGREVRLAYAYGQEVTGVDISGGSFPSRRHTPDGRSFHCLKRDAVGRSFAADGSADTVVTMWARGYLLPARHKQQERRDSESHGSKA